LLPTSSYPRGCRSAVRIARFRCCSCRRSRRRGRTAAAWARPARRGPLLPRLEILDSLLRHRFRLGEGGSFGSPPCAFRSRSERSGFFPGAGAFGPGAGKNWSGMGGGVGSGFQRRMIPSGSFSSFRSFGTPGRWLGVTTRARSTSRWTITEAAVARSREIRNRETFSGPGTRASRSSRTRVSVSPSGVRAKPPSGSGHGRGASSPPTTWSFRRGKARSLTCVSSSSAWKSSEGAR